MTQAIADAVLAGLAVPPRRPPADRPVPGCAMRVLHSGCRWVQPHELKAQRLAQWQISWSDRGAPTTTWRGGSLRQHPGVIVAIPPGLTVTRTASVSYVHLYLSVQLACRLSAASPLVRNVGGAERDLLRRIAAPLTARVAPTPAEGLAMQTLAGLVLAELPGDAWPALPDDRRVRDALTRIEDDPVGAPGNAALAAQAGLSLGRFLRLFRDQVGCSPQRLRLDLRLDAAAAALGAGASVKEVAARHGWRARGRFALAFRRRFGAGPAEWRRRLGE